MHFDTNRCTSDHELCTCICVNCCGSAPSKLTFAAAAAADDEVDASCWTWGSRNFWCFTLMCTGRKCLGRVGGGKTFLPFPDFDDNVKPSRIFAICAVESTSMGPEEKTNNINAWIAKIVLGETNLIYSLFTIKFIWLQCNKVWLTVPLKWGTISLVPIPYHTILFYTPIQENGIDCWQLYRTMIVWMGL